MGFSNSANFLPQNFEDYRGFQPGGIIVQVARFGEKGAGENEFQPACWPGIRQRPRKIHGTTVPNSVAARQRDRLVQVEVASPRGFEPLLPP